MKSEVRHSNSRASPQPGKPRALLGPPRGMRLPIAAEYVGVSESKFLQMVKEGVMPKPFRTGGVTLWDLRKIDTAFDALANQDDDSIWEDVHA